MEFWDTGKTSISGKCRVCNSKENVRFGELQVGKGLFGAFGVSCITLWNLCQNCYDKGWEPHPGNTITTVYINKYTDEIKEIP